MGDEISDYAITKPSCCTYLSICVGEAMGSVAAVGGDFRIFRGSICGHNLYCLPIYT